MKYDYINNQKLVDLKEHYKSKYINTYKINEDKDWNRKDRKSHFIRFVLVSYLKKFSFLFQKQLAFICGCSIDLVKKVYAKLKSEGILIKNKNNNGKKNRRLYLYVWSITEKDPFRIQSNSVFTKYLNNNFSFKGIKKTNKESDNKLDDYQYVNINFDIIKKKT